MQAKATRQSPHVSKNQHQTKTFRTKSLSKTNTNPHILRTSYLSLEIYKNQSKLPTALLSIQAWKKLFCQTNQFKWWFNQSVFYSLSWWAEETFIPTCEFKDLLMGSVHSRVRNHCNRWFENEIIHYLSRQFSSRCRQRQVRDEPARPQTRASNAHPIQWPSTSITRGLI